MVKISRTSVLICMVVGLACLAGSPQAHAAFRLTISGGGAADQVIDDNGAGDLDPTVGEILFSGMQGIFTSVIEIGSSNSQDQVIPALLTLNNFELSGEAGSITLTLEDDDFMVPDPGPIVVTTQASFSGTAPEGSSVMNSTFIDGTLINSAGETITAGTPVGADSVSTGSMLTGTNPYTLTSVFTVTLTGAALVNSTGLSAVAVPEPASIAVALAAMPLLAIGCYRHRRQTRS